MAKYIFTRPNGPWQYPTLGFTADVDDVIEADAAPDLWWEETDAGATVTLPAIPEIAGVEEPVDGAVGIWNRQTNTVDFVTEVPDVNLPARLSEAELSATIGSVVDGALADTPVALSNVRHMYIPVQEAWGDGLAAVRNGDRDAKVLILGDSTAAGIGGSTEASFPQQKAWPSVLAELLDSLSIPAAHGLAVPKSSSGAMPNDTRWTIPDAGWTQANAAVGFANKSTNWSKASPGAQRLRFNDPRILADRFDIYYSVSTSSSYGAFTATATGGSGTVVTTGSQVEKSIRKVTISAASAATTNVVEIVNTGASGAVYIIGIEPWLSTRCVVRIGNAGISGSNSADWVKFHDDDTANEWNALAAIRAYEPDLTIIDIGINDADPAILTAPATFRARIEQLVDAAVAAGSSVVIKTMIPSDATRFAHEEDLVAELLDLGLPTIDIFSRYGAYQADLMDDAVHGNDAMYVEEGRYIHSALVTSPLTPVARSAGIVLPARKAVSITPLDRWDADQIAQYDGSYVQEWIGQNGHVLNIGTAGWSAPRLQRDAAGEPVVQFDGVRNGLTGAVNRTQPFTIIMQGRLRALGVGNSMLIASAATTTRGSLFVDNTGLLKGNAGSTLTLASPAVPLTDQVFALVLNGASSIVRYGANTVTGAAGAENAALLFLGRWNAGDAAALDISRVLIYASALSGAQITTLVSELTA